VFAQYTNIEEVTVGDTFKDIGAGATIINRSTLTNAMNRVATGSDKEVSEALKQVAEFIESQGNTEASDAYSGFLEELEKPKPRKPMLKILWDGAVTALPSIATLAAAVAKIATLF
jgi:hypothetical protein